MKIKTLVICFFIIIARHFYAQINLVPNPGFEIDTSCVPVAGGVNIGYVPPWDTPTDGTPDVDNTCNPLSSCSVPYNGWGFQHPHSGNGYIGMGFYSNGGLGLNYREYLQVELDSVLIAQHIYCASFYVSSANTSRVACNNFGIYFSPSHTYIPIYDTLSFIPQINDTNIVSDTANWTMISGQYTALGGEKYIIIGNFYSNALTDTIHRAGTSSDSYYFLDDVSVTDCTPGLGVKETSVSDFNLFPNPATNELRIEGLKHKAQSIKVINVIGQMVKEINNKQMTQGVIEIDVGELARGLYFVEIQTEKGTARKKFAKK